DGSVRGGVGREMGKRLPSRLALRVSGSLVLREAASCLTELVDSRCKTRVLTELEDELAAGRSQRLVDAGEHTAQSVCSVHGEQAQPGRIVARAERRQRGCESLSAQNT